jgi:hypothetical protein
MSDSMTDRSSKAETLAKIAGAVAATDPGRAAQLIADAERTAQSITREFLKASALASIAGAVAATDPNRAERMTQSITDVRQKASALVMIAEA